jgi:hypothetical protein
LLLTGIGCTADATAGRNLISSLTTAQMLIGSGIHEGHRQGVACRRFVFENAYIELQW